MALHVLRPLIVPVWRVVDCDWTKIYKNSVPLFPAVVFCPHDSIEVASMTGGKVGALNVRLLHAM